MRYTERARQLVERARTFERKGEVAKALGAYDEALGLLNPGTLDPFLADVLRWKGTLLRERGETEAAYRNYTHMPRARVACRRHGRGGARPQLPGDHCPSAAATQRNPSACTPEPRRSPPRRERRACSA